MNTVTLTLGSVTYAIKVRKLLMKYKVNSTLIKVEGTNEKGCAYGIKFNKSDFLSIIRILKENEIEYYGYNEKFL